MVIFWILSVCGSFTKSIKIFTESIFIFTDILLSLYQPYFSQHIKSLSKNNFPWSNTTSCQSSSKPKTFQQITTSSSSNPNLLPRKPTNPKSPPPKRTLPTSYGRRFAQKKMPSRRWDRFRVRARRIIPTHPAARSRSNKTLHNGYAPRPGRARRGGFAPARRGAGGSLRNRGAGDRPIRRELRRGKQQELRGERLRRRGLIRAAARFPREIRWKARLLLRVDLGRMVLENSLRRCRLGDYLDVSGLVRD